MFDFLCLKNVRNRTLQQVSTLDRHMKRDIGISDVESVTSVSAPILLLPLGPSPRYDR